MGGFEPQGGSNWRWNGREWVDVRRERVFPWRPVGLVAAVLLVLVIGFFALSAIRNRTGNSGSTSTLPTAAPATGTKPSAAPSLAPQPSAAPASAAGVDSITLTRTGGSCQPGSGCELEVSVRFPLTASPQDFAWTIQAVDACTGAITDLGQDHVTAQTGWNNVIGDRSVTLPASKGSLKLVAVTSTPARAGSPPLQIPGGSC